MKIRIIYIALILLLPLAVQGQATEPLKIGVISDTHYLSEKLMDGGYAVEDYMYASGRMIQYTPAILDSVMHFYLHSNWKPDVLLICGDITKDGERQSHIDFAKKLKPLQEAGTKVFVIPGNHDINVPDPIGYVGNRTYQTENTSPEEFVHIYNRCGYADAFDRDTASLSYAAVLDEHTWLVAIDAAQYKRYTNRTLSEGRISQETEKWIVNILDEAKSKNISVIGMMHWGITEHFMYQSALMKNYLVDDYGRLRQLFADKGMRVIFTGHCHANDITTYLSPEGNKLHDVETASLSSYPFAYRFVYYYPDQANVMTFNINSLPENLRLVDESKGNLLRIGKQLAKNKLKALYMTSPKETEDILTEFAAQLFILHMAGDETITPELQSLADDLNKINNQMGGDISDFELDFFPSDNNTVIQF
ncbi:metallophosphoesterase [Dysgonomonas sp. 25]|uniref:metallophosphoesterase family protein n=1 Tax=Dysgonomonas sp. 25 TaxID=2302933 RepID=UPI0013D8744A|nr:metallophosphoesterase [Dysgonomonas sp. 25]NDV68079.1 metallophosphoesterase [Dysgonomonas sp. 25]